VTSSSWNIDFKHEEYCCWFGTEKNPQLLVPDESVTHWYLDTDCRDCSDHCESCTERGPGLCDDGRCESGFTLDSSNKCSIGITLCTLQNCASCPVPSVCDTCISSDYVLRADGSGCDVACTLPNCTSCSAPNVCITCNSPEKNVLRADGSGCDECSVISGGSCTLCLSATKCGECAKTREGPVTGTTTAECAPCEDTNCEVCLNNNAICTSCDGEFGLDATMGVCTACEDTNCEVCHTNNAICTSCYSGFDLDVNMGVCMRAVSAECTLTNCASCSGPTVCETCISGPYWLRADRSGCGGPDECAAGCDSCSHSPPGGCDHCHIGTGLINGIGTPPADCEPCTTPDCLMCFDNNTYCESCKDEFELDSATKLCVAE